MPRRLPIVFALLVSAVEERLAPDALAATPPAGFVETVLVDATAVSLPTAAAYEPGSGALFFLEKGDGTRGGPARVLRRDPQTGTVSTALSVPCVDSRGERGLLGIAFDPDYALPGGANRWVYLFYTRWVTASGTCAVPDVREAEYNRIVRYRESGGTLSGEEVLLNGPALGTQNHNGGTVRFLPDGTLMISMGDNDSDAFPVPYARDLADLRGKMLRIGRDGSIPPDNPFVGQPDRRPEIWAWGLRNPFRFSVDEADGTVWIADVGESRWEEIDRGVPGADYGWPCFEATEPFVGCDPAPAPGTTTFPAFAYGHSGQTAPVEGDSVTGGPVYRGTSFPAEYHGAYFFGDYDSGWIRRARVTDSGTLTDVETFLPDAASVVDIAVSPSGCLTWVSLTQGIRDVCYVGGDNGQPRAVATAAPAWGLAPLAVQFDGTASSDPDGDPLAHAWSFGDSTSGSGPTPSKTYTADGVYQAVLTVDDGRAAPNSTDVSPPLRIVVGNRAPQGTIDSPAAGTRYDAGDTIGFSGSATDPEDGALPPSGFEWTVVFHHEDHTHPFLGPIVGTTSGSFTVPTSGEDAVDVFFRIRLEASDSGAPLGPAGTLSHTSWVDVLPNVTTLSVEADPAGAGLELGIDRRFQPAPWSKSSVVNFPRTLTAPTSQSASGAMWEFESWSNGGAAEHTVSAPAAPSTYVASYRCVSGCAFTPTLTATRLSGSAVRWEWNALGCARAHDLVRGSLASLRSGGGEYGAAVQGCVANDLETTSVEESSTPTGGGSWFLLRGVGCLGAGTYDEHGVPSQAGSRDAGIGASPSSCADGDEFTPVLTLAKTAPDATQLTWTAVGCASAYDAVRGDLPTLRGTSGDFAAAVKACIANDLGVTQAQDATPAAPGGGLWFLVRGVGCGGAGTYDEDGAHGQIRSRDPGIAASALACP